MELDQGMSGADDKRYCPPTPFLRSIKFWIQARLLQAFIKLLLTFKKRPATEQPTYIKTYPSLPSISIRVWVPKEYKPGQGGKKLPLFIDIHGGGFTISDARTCDGDNALLAYKHGICVVAISYRKGPTWRFPTAVHDCAELIEEVLADTELDKYVDKTNVAVGGYSAGGNLSLTATQLRGLHGRIKGVVAYYPVVDYTRDLQTKISYSTIAPGRKADMLASLGPIFNWAYLPTGTDYRQPLLSPIFAERGKLVPKICFFGCEYDFLCGEARDMAEQLAEDEKGEKRESKDGDSWEKGGIRWELLRGVEHGYNQTPPDKDPAKQNFKRETMVRMHEHAADWLFREVYV